MDVLAQYDLIHEDWKKDIENLKNKIVEIEDISSLFWMGFLFVEGPGDEKNDNEDYIKEQMNIQIGPYLEANAKYSNADIRYCYTKQENLALNMKKNKDYILNEIITSC